MSYQVLARKYRPQKFSEVIGQDHVTRTLKNAIEQQRIAHGYIFSGHRGIGKTTIARILAMALNCRAGEGPQAEPCGTCDACVEVRAGNAVDVIEIDAATNRGIDEIRELREAARYRPARDRYKIYILDEAHQITDAAFNALLKTLEEPPGHVIFMMATTQPEDIPQTIRSRCQHFSFHAVRFEEIVGQLKSIARQEGIDAADDAIAVLSEAGDGSMRDALSIMDQAIACCGTTLTADVVRGLVGSVGSEVLEELMGAVADNSSETALRVLDRLMTQGQNPSHFAKQLVRFLRNAVMAKVAGEDSGLLQISSDERARVARVAARFSEEDLARFLQILLRTHDELGYRQEQRFHLELGVLKMVHAQRLLPLEQLLSAVATGSQGVAPARPASSPAAGGVAAAGRASGVPASSARPSPAANASPFERSASAVSKPSPFETDRARKRGGEEMSAAAPAGEVAAMPARHAATAPQAQPASQTATAIAVAEEAAPAEVSLESVRDAVLQALESAGQNMLLHMLEAGEWSLAASEVMVKVSQSATVVDMSVGAEPKKLSTEAATRAAGRPMRLKVTGGVAVAPGNGTTERPARSGPGARSRAADDPVVKHFQERFKAEIRTVIDHTKK